MICCRFCAIDGIGGLRLCRPFLPSTSEQRETALAGGGPTGFNSDRVSENPMKGSFSDRLSLSSWSCPESRAQPNLEVIQILHRTAWPEVRQTRSHADCLVHPCACRRSLPDSWRPWRSGVPVFLPASPCWRGVTTPRRRSTAQRLIDPPVCSPRSQPPGVLETSPRRISKRRHVQANLITHRSIALDYGLELESWAAQDGGALEPGQPPRDFNLFAADRRPEPTQPLWWLRPILLKCKLPQEPVVSTADTKTIGHFLCGWDRATARLTHAPHRLEVVLTRRDPVLPSSRCRSSRTTSQPKLRCRVAYPRGGVLVGGRHDTCADLLHLVVFSTR